MGSAAIGALVEEAPLGAFVALGALVALGAFVADGDLVDLGALVEDGDLVDLGALVDEGSLVAFGAFGALVAEGSLVALGALVAAGSLVAFNCLLLTTGCSSATTAAMSAQRRVIIVADFILFFFECVCFDVLIDLCFYDGMNFKNCESKLNLTKNSSLEFLLTFHSSVWYKPQSSKIPVGYFERWVIIFRQFCLLREKNRKERESDRIGLKFVERT